MGVASGVIKLVTIEEIVRFALSQGSFAQSQYPANELYNALKNEHLKYVTGETHNPKQTQNTANADSTKTSNKTHTPINIVDPLSSGFKNMIDDPVNRHCLEQITVDPDSLMLSKYKLKTFKRTRDYIMENINSPIIPGHTLAVLPVIPVFVGAKNSFNYTATNVIDHKVIPYKLFYDLISNNPNNKISDIRLIEQADKRDAKKGTLEDLEIMQALQYFLKNDNEITLDEQKVLAEMLREKNYDRLLLGVFTYHEGKFKYLGEKVRKETFPQLFEIYSYVDTIFVPVSDTTERKDTTSTDTSKTVGQSGQPTGNVSKEDSTKKDLEKTVLGAGIGVNYENNQDYKKNFMSPALELYINNLIISGNYNSESFKTVNDILFPGPVGLSKDTDSSNTKYTSWAIGVRYRLTDFMSLGVGMKNITTETKGKTQSYQELLEYSGNIIKILGDPNHYESEESKTYVGPVIGLNTNIGGLMPGVVLGAYYSEEGKPIYTLDAMIGFDIFGGKNE